MKFLKKGLKIVVFLVILIVVLIFVYSKVNEPKYSGELEIKNLSDDVTVYFDEIGVPHINAQNQKDAYLALGYIHAQDRLWQMELIRRIAPGRLSEIFGKDLVSTDVFFSGLGIEEAADKTIAGLDKSSDSYMLTQAYLDGINQYLEEGSTPLEFRLLGIEKEKYTIKDIYNVFGYMSFSFAVAHKTDPLLTEIKEKLGKPYLDEVLGAYSKNLLINKMDSVSKINSNFSKSVSAIMDQMPVPPLIGSNSWVIGADKTKNGKVIFANDPHIGYSQPSVWYQNHIKTPDFEMYGFNIALMPFPLLGHNKNYAYGLTMLANDDLNFYIEENNPKNDESYKIENGYQFYETRTKTINIKGGADTTFTVKVSKHGPIMNGIISHLEDERPVAMNWIYTQLKNEMLDVSYGISHSNSINDFKKSVAKIHAPGLNVMYGDADDNIAWFASAKLYQLRDSLFSKMYLNGASGKDEIIEYLDFSENPKSINPKSNYVYSANHQPDSVRGKLYPGYYQPENRSKRIVNLLEAKNDFTKQDVAKMLYDVTSSVDHNIARDLLKFVSKGELGASEKQAFSILENWEGVYLKTSIAPTIYNRFLFEFLQNTYKDELGSGFDLFINSQLQDQVLVNQIDRENSVWWDDISTKNKVETKEEIITKSYKSAIAFLQNQLGANVESWTWDRVISVEHEHAIGKAGGILRKIFNVGPFKTIGGNEVINNQIFKLDSTGIYKITSGPSSRRVVDFSDVENSLGIIPTGQSGNIFSDYYKNQAEKYVDGKFEKMKLNEAEIKKSEHVLILKPKE
ncbi:penicillin acylase family protein [Polaribacter reichenbachii]|uniref:Penicillin amidase n=1 Tax=Polaribacter reichenbachii TaxID=996801 RepID=A0A1B8TRW0_9FLAO|nr:penicillin acylase family protein [Polaribacter reichenbachii]APZ44964.1 penicillin acylase family protein [Polaribacter reichenbachii]AUC18827.1 penicillin acylase family protein [Polaribacter reichenbachii]OBY62342.1 penicillin amidase [Polaribacter reichenbachii]